ncbi:hypothetical protein ACHAP5_009737 [Fusarium lateritium]
MTVTRAMARKPKNLGQSRRSILKQTPAASNIQRKLKQEEPKGVVSPEEPPRPFSVKTNALLSEKKLASWSRHSASSPFPDFNHPSAEEFQIAHRLLHDMHGDAVKENFAQGDEPVADGKYTSVMEALVVAALSQATSWRNAKRAMNHMKEVYGSTFAYDAIVEGGVDKLRDALRPGGMQNRKSKILMGLLQDVKSRHGCWDLQFLFNASDEDVIKEVVSYWGLGPKCAHCLMSICLKRDRFAVDTHIYRLSGLWGWRPSNASVESAQAHLDHRIPNEIKFLLHYEMIVHVSQTDIDRIKTKLAAKKEPWTASWNKLTSIPFSSVDYENNAVKEVNRGQNGEALWHDAAAAFNLALRWKISGDDQYADAASNILVAWADKLEVLSGGDDAYLTAGLQGYELANAAELLRDYEPFVKKGLSSVVGMLNEIFLPMNLDFLNQVLGSQHNVKHFFANWEQCNIASALAIAVVTDNQTTWDFAIDYFKNGVGNGAINNAISDIVKEPGTGTLLGQGQESGRDQGHSAMNFQLLGAIGQQAWNQGEDLFAYNNSRLLLGAEYFARYNLGNDVPFEPYTNGIVSFDTISEASRGAIRPAWELLHSHYVRIKGLKAPWTTAYLNNSLEFFGGFEGGAGSWGEGSGHYDGLGWGSLLHHLDESDVPAEKSSASSSAAAKTSKAVVAKTEPVSILPSTLRAVPTTTATNVNQATITQPKPTQTDTETLAIPSSPATTATSGIVHKPGKGCRARRPNMDISH